MRFLAGTSGRVAEAQSAFVDELFADDNVLFLYAAQRTTLHPAVEEKWWFRNGTHHVDICWSLGCGAQHRGSGSASKKREARRDAAKKLLRGTELSEAAIGYARKQVLNGLLVRLGASVVSEGAVPPSAASTSAHVHRLVWRVPVAGPGRRMAELSRDGAGASAEEAYARAAEAMYFEATKLPAAGRGGAGAPAAPARGKAKAAPEAVRLEPAAEEVLSPEAAGEVSARHSAIVNSRRIEAQFVTSKHQAGQHASLSWRWVDEHGAMRTRTASAVAPTLKAARGAVALELLVAEGFAEDLGIRALNRAARVCALAKAGDREAARAAAALVEEEAPAVWSLALPDAWALALASRASEPSSSSTAPPPGEERSVLSELETALRRRVARPDFPGMAPALWEQLLDLAAHAACGGASRAALEAVDRLPLSPGAFASSAEAAYFQHFRRLVAWERVGGNQAAVDLLASQASEGFLMEKERSFFPYVTLTMRAASESLLFLDQIQARDIVFFQALPDDGSPAMGHLGVVTSVGRAAAIAGGSGSQCSLTLRSYTLRADHAEASSSFRVHGLDSEVTIQRSLSALRGAAPPAGRQTLAEPLRQLIVGSFLPDGAAGARAAAEQPPKGSEAIFVPQRLGLAAKAAQARGQPFTSAQELAVRSALERRATLIHGPPGTGKTTAAAGVVLAWRSLGDKILCVADSNAAADNLHAALAARGVRALRFAFGRSPEASPGGAAERLGDGGSSRRGAGSPRSKRGARAEQGDGQGYLEMKDAINDYQVVVTTCASAGHPMLDGAAFPRVLVDECTQSIEPCTMIPLTRGCEHLVLIGDHRQLPPTVLTDEARRGGLERSLFARLAAESIVEPVLLDEQRRMHPSIAEFPNRHFYEGRVRDAAPARPPVPGLPWPRGGEVRVLLVDVAPEQGEERRGTSWSNTGEAEAVLDLADALIGGRHPALPAEELAVITPYEQQKRALQAACARRRAGGGGRAVAGARVANIDGFQGAECDLVIFSAVRSNEDGQLGFLRDHRRANVVLTRARRGLVVFADASTMRKAEGSVWAHWLSWAESQDAVISLGDFQAALRA